MAVVGMEEISSRARRAQFLQANEMTARSVAGYLSVVAPVDQIGSEYQLIAMLSAVHTLAASPRWHRGIQVAWGNSPLLSDSLHLIPLDSTTRRKLADSTGSVFVERAGRTVALVPMLDRDLRNSIGWVAAWGMLAPEGKSPFGFGLLVLVAVAGSLALVLPSPLLPNRTRWWLVLVAASGAVLLGVHQSYRVNMLASRRDAMVQGRVRQLVERAVTMRRIDERQLGRIAPGWHTELRPPVDSVAAGNVRIPLRSGLVLEISPLPRAVGWSRFQRTLAGLVAGFVLGLGLGAWGRGGRRLEKAESSENGAPQSN